MDKNKTCRAGRQDRFCIGLLEIEESAQEGRKLGTWDLVIGIVVG